MDVSTLHFWTGIGVAVLCGTIVGLDRQLRGKPAGIRTSILICLGTSLYISLGVAQAGENSDTTRVLGQVVVGIGFLGAGVIFARGATVVGITSAAVIWILAGIGAMIGFEWFEEAIVVAFITVVILSGIKFIETRFPGLLTGAHAPGDDKGNTTDN
ncbi:MAG: MgtC/SapB family protein [Dehalococcoidia bacterium]|jgi:putative Mg2+ transporter-C (MgtC) family protein|nr:MgtC/SapB family protein [Dehalococcoidia bacterium]